MNNNKDTSLTADKHLAEKGIKIGNASIGKFERIIKNFKGVLEWIGVFFLLTQVVVVVYVVFGRFVLNKTPVWGEEIALLSMIWLSLFSAVIAEIDSAHINISLIDKVLSDRAIKIRDLVFHLMNIAFSLVLTIEGLKLVIKLRHAVMPGSRLPLWILYISVPASSAFLLLAILKKIIKKEA
ncbi:MAG TPA: TRAP transporter small permease [Rectinemataceae bacterium]|nr:TRAP transporter small permease [Rectinemataceae bacterium]